MIDNCIEKTLKRELLQWFAENPPRDGSQFADAGDVVISTAKNARSENQDRAIYAQFMSERTERCFSLLAVLDGIGGMIEGGRCAEVAIASILSSLVSLSRFNNRVTLVEALTIANSAVWEEYKGRGGATFAGVFYENKHARSVNIGDSRVYSYDSSRGIMRLSSDDRLGDQFAKLKGLENVSLNPEIADRLGQYLGMAGRTTPNIKALDDAVLRSPQNYILISTDGAHVAGEQFIASTIRSHFQTGAIADAIIKQASIEANADNATILCAKATAVQADNRNYHSPFEHLRVASINGVFNFAIQNSLLKIQPSPRPFRSRDKRKQRSEQPQEKKSPITEESKPVDPLEKPSIGKRAKQKVTIQQLTFKPIPDNESS